jgi:phosphatidylserine decarboxylase
MELPLENYQNFNQFFTRKLKPDSRKIDLDKNILISPADSKLMVYKIKNSLVVPVKGLKYTIGDLLKNQKLAENYSNGYCMVFRLAPMDYHRFCYIDNGTQEKVINIDGLYYSVHPYALSKSHPAFTENHRHYTVLETENFGDLVYMEVGAMFVGKIFQHNYSKKKFTKGEEKGYFEFGGSTIVLLFKENTIQVDENILNFSSQGIETIVKYGSSIGQKANS